MINEFISVLDAASRLYDRGYGLDIYGGESVFDVVKSVFKGLVFRITMGKFGGLTGRMRNVVVDNNDRLLLIDLHMHDLGKSGKIAPILRAFNHMSFYGLVHILKHANGKLSLSKRLADSEIDCLNYHASFLERKIVDLIFWFIFPLLDFDASLRKCKS